MQRYSFAVLFLALTALSACSPQSPAVSPSRSPTPYIASTPTPEAAASPTEAAGVKTAPSGLQYEDLEVGEGSRPLFSQTVRVRYRGFFPNGKQFDSNIGQGDSPFEFKLGQPGMIKGWDLGIGGGDGIPAMRVGGSRKLIIPPKLGYGDKDYGKIPANSTLIFEVTLVGVKN